MTEPGKLPRYECRRCGHVWAANEQDALACPECGPKFHDKPSISLVKTSRVTVRAARERISQVN